MNNSVYLHAIIPISGESETQNIFGLYILGYSWVYYTI